MIERTRCRRLSDIFFVITAFGVLIMIASALIALNTYNGDTLKLLLGASAFTALSCLLFVHYGEKMKALDKEVRKLY